MRFLKDIPDTAKNKSFDYHEDVVTTCVLAGRSMPMCDPPDPYTVIPAGTLGTIHVPYNRMKQAWVKFEHGTWMIGYEHLDRPMSDNEVKP